MNFKTVCHRGHRGHREKHEGFRVPGLFYRYAAYDTKTAEFPL